MMNEKFSNTDSPTASCNLCGLILRHGGTTVAIDGKSYSFCCTGCRQVFIILLEATGSADPENFRETDLFRQCRESGLIPGTEADLASTESARPLEGSSTQGPAQLRSTRTPAASPAAGLELSLKVGNMWCPACAWVIDETLKKTNGILDASCNFSTDRLHIHYNPVQTSPAQIIQIIGKLGYIAAVPDEPQPALERRKEFVRFAISAFLTMNVMMMSYALYSGFFTAMTPETVQKLSWPAFIMATIVLVYGGVALFKKAWAGLTHAAFSMETLIIIGSLSAYLYSTVNLFTGSIHLYYDTASMLITLVLLGKALERRAKDRVLESLENFFTLKPTKVRICTAQTPRGRYVAVEQLVSGDLFRVDENEIVSADGWIESGSGVVDESALTGEPLPIAKKPGDSLKSGSRIIKGSFTVNAVNVGGDATLGQMVDIIEKTLLAKTPLEGKTDVVLQWFVPLIILLAAATALFCLLGGISAEESMLRAVTVMVISCPCALGIAIPLARVAGISIAGKKGILVRTFTAFEQTEKINAFVFDKTGTVTAGRWDLLDILPVAPMTADEALALAAGLEANSGHFIAREIMRQAAKRCVVPVEFETVRIEEKGIAAEREGKTIKIGSADFLSGEFAKVGRPSAENHNTDAAKHSRVYMAVDGRPVAVFVFGDTLRNSAKATIAQLKSAGHHIMLVSGDGELTTRAVGHTIGVADALGNCLPAHKAALVRELQDRGYQTAMVGDGINDAPAMVQSDLAIAVYSGGHLSKEVSDITLMQAEPGQIIDFFNFARQVNKKISQNLVFTFLYNAVAIPVAVGGWLNPLVAVSAMLLSSLSVTGNTLMLVRKNT